MFVISWPDPLFSHDDNKWALVLGWGSSDGNGLSSLKKFEEIYFYCENIDKINYLPDDELSKRRW